MRWRGIISGDHPLVENISPVQVWEALQSNPDARLVDVRTDAEWNFVGMPDLSPVGQEPVLIPWQVYPTMQVNGAFTEHMRSTASAIAAWRRDGRPRACPGGRSNAGFRRQGTGLCPPVVRTRLALDGREC